jgi:hypothetical protein
MNLISLPSGRTPIAWSSQVPGLQTKVNSSGLGTYKTCPRKYYYEYVRGLRTRAPMWDADFGTLLHKASEIYDKTRLEPQGHQGALENALCEILIMTWDAKAKRPFQFDHPIKNRTSLIRTIIWYLDHYGANESLELIVLPDGTPALELQFEFDSGYVAPTGERIMFCGRLDKVVRATFDGHAYIKDIKTTKYELSAHYFAQFAPDTQMSLYPIAGKVCFDFDVAGVIVDGVQIGVGFSRFKRAKIEKPDEVLEEWLVDSHFWLAQMSRSAIEDHWPQNDKACGLYGGCDFRSVCAMRPKARETWLMAGWEQVA